MGKLPGSVWEIATEPLRVPDHLGIDHFAAFPSALPRRIILGWSPSGICTACGEGRRPVADKAHVLTQRTGAEKQRPGLNNRHLTEARSRRRVEVDLTGEACACPAPLVRQTIREFDYQLGETVEREVERPDRLWRPTAPTTPAVVLDPFGGTGTTALVAKALGRNAISVDMSADYCRLAEWRVSDPGELAKAMRVEKPPKPLDGQIDLFDGVA